MVEEEVIIPQRDIESLARCLLPQIQKFFDSEEGKREFAECQARQRKRQTAKSPPDNGGD
jgi:hypothetical protein